MNKFVTGSKARLTIGGKPVAYAHSAEYSVAVVPIEVQRLCLVLSRLGIRSAEKLHPWDYKGIQWTADAEL